MKTSKQDPPPKKATAYGHFFLDKNLCVNFKPLCYCNFMQKFYAVTFENTRKVILGPFWVSFGLKIFRTKPFPQRSFASNLSLYTAVTSCKKKSEKLHSLIFDKTWKTSFWAHFGPLVGLKISKEDFLQKSHLGQF